MKTFGTILPKDYIVETVYASSNMSWELVSSSVGIRVTSPEEYWDAINIFRAINNPNSSVYNIENGVQEYSMYRSVRHLFGDDLTLNSDNFYIVSIGQLFYGDRIKPGSFELTIDSEEDVVLDDGVGNLYVSQSGTGSLVGNIFYEHGIATINHNTSSIGSSVDNVGINIVDSSEVYIDYSSDVRIEHHEINVKVESPDFNYSLFNPSMRSSITTTGSVTQSFEDIGLPSSSVNTWSLYNLMGAGVIKPYITSIGLYNDKHELLAVAKVSTPIQRTFDMEQVFVIKFVVGS